MQDSTRKFLEDYLSNEQKELLDCDPSKIRESMSKETDDERIEKAAEKYKLPQLALLAALHRVEADPKPENIFHVIRCAIRTDDFVTALYWHKKLHSGTKLKLSDKFEQYFLSVMAQQQKQQDPTAEPFTDSQKLCSKASDTSRTLQDPQYLEHSIKYRTQLAEAYQEKINAAEESLLLPAMKKADKAFWRQVLVGLMFLIAGGVFLWKTYGIVAAAIDKFFFYSIVSLISWTFPLAYAILVIILDCVLIWLFTKGIGKNGKKKLKHSLGDIWISAEDSLVNSEDYRALMAMNNGEFLSFQSYDMRLTLGALSAMSGEQNFEKLWKMTSREESTWLTQLIPPNKYASQPYKEKINDLIQKDAPDSDLFLGFTLAYKQEGKSRSDYFGDGGIDGNFFGAIFMVDLHGNKRILFERVERFLLDELQTAKMRSDHTRMGEVYYELYLQSMNVSDELAYKYGSAGLNYSDELKYRVMYNSASHRSDDRYYNPYLALGFTRDDAEKYAAELVAKGDPRGKELQKHFVDVDRRAAKRTAEEEAAEAAERAERERAERERAEAARERARAELNDQMDRIERGVNQFWGNGYTTEEERYLEGKVSYLDSVKYEEKRRAAIEKKLDDMEALCE